jgi:hypothetical protein
MKRYLAWIGASLALALLCSAIWITAPVDLAGKRMAGDAARDVRSFITPQDVKKYGSIEDVQAAWAAGYHYLPDAWYVDNGHNQRLALGSDTIFTGAEVQRIMNHTTERYMDCDKGAIWGTSALRAAGYDAWFCAGTLEQWDEEGQYLGKFGHAWVLVKVSGAWFLWETTIYNDTTTPVLIPWPVHSDQVRYTLEWRTTDRITIREPFKIDLGGTAPPAVTPDRIILLRRALEDLEP